MRVYICGLMNYRLSCVQAILAFQWHMPLPRAATMSAEPRTYQYHNVLVSVILGCQTRGREEHLWQQTLLRRKEGFQYRTRCPGSSHPAHHAWNNDSGHGQLHIEVRVNVCTYARGQRGSLRCRCGCGADTDYDGRYHRPTSLQSSLTLPKRE